MSAVRTLAIGGTSLRANTTVLIKNGIVVDSSGQRPVDILIEGETIFALVEPGKAADLEDTKNVLVIDAEGHYVLPGGVDPHCHVNFKSGPYTSLDNHVEATRAAVLGGTTTIVDFSVPAPDETPLMAVHRQLKLIPGSLCDVALHGCVVQWDETTAEQLHEISELGISTIKMYTTYRGETMANEDTILAVMRHLADHGGMVVIHCEANHIIEENQRVSAHSKGLGAAHHHKTRSSLAELAAVSEVLAIAETVDAPVYFVHQSTAEAVELVSAARRRGLNAFSEAVVHHLRLDDSLYLSEHPERYVCCPPLRSADEVKGLQSKALSGEINTIASDHCCYDLKQKEENSSDVRNMPNGLPGVETRLPVAFTLLVNELGMPMSRFVELTSTNPAKLNGLYPRKGCLLPGSDADIVLWDPRIKRRISHVDLHMATDYTPFEDIETTGWPVTVLVRGQLIVHNGELIDGQANGHFAKSSSLSNLESIR